MAACFYFRLLSVAHGAAAFPKAVEASIEENTEFATTDGDGQITDECIGIKRNTVECDVSCNKPISPIAKLTSASFTVTLGADDMSTTGTVTCPTAVAGGSHLRAGGGEVRFGQKFRYKGASVDPVSVSA